MTFEKDLRGLMLYTREVINTTAELPSLKTGFSRGFALALRVTLGTSLIPCFFIDPFLYFAGYRLVLKCLP